MAAVVVVERRRLEMWERYDRSPHPGIAHPFRVHQHDFPCEAMAWGFTCTRLGCEWTEGAHVGWHEDSSVDPPAIWPADPLPLPAWARD